MAVKINSIGKTFCPADWTWDTSKQHWEDMDLWLVLEGKGSIITRDQEYHISRGDCFVFRSWESYLGFHDRHNPLTVIHIHFELTEEKEVEIAEQKEIETAEQKEVEIPEVRAIERQVEIPELHRYIIKPEFIIELAQRVLIYVEEAGINSHEASLWLELLLKEIIRIDGNTKKNKSELEIMIQDTCRFICKDLSLHHKVKVLAHRSGYSHDYFSKVFKEIQGLSPEKYMINKRIQLACSLLRESNMSISRISELLGYKESDHFSKQFKSLMGKSPRGFR